ncbi:hypothetical protein [Tahibacter caeni]|uniref:hypothetical protein n=1 Tax=Tahibacter caeni TaxID=1453545 RepID=UPI0021480AC4|nr:hypothetical protein [Tahibacter caeni]
MKISEMRDQVAFFSAKASDIARQLAFAGIAVIWVFKIGGGSSGGSETSPPIAPGDLMPAVFLLVSCLACDFLHYIVAALAWHLKAESCMEKRDKDEHGNPIAGKDFPAGNTSNWGDFFFYAKSTLLMLGYFCLLKFILYKWGIISYS